MYKLKNPLILKQIFEDFVVYIILYKFFQPDIFPFSLWSDNLFLII